MLGAWLRSSVPGLGGGSCSSRGDRRRSRPRPKARGAGSDHPGIGRAAERGRGRQARRPRPASGVALAAPLRRGRRRRALARGEPQAGQGAVGRRHGPPRGGAELRRAAGRGHPLDRPCHGQEGRQSSCARCSASGRRTTCSRTASAPSSARATPTSLPSSRTSSAFYIDPPKHAIVLSVDEKSQIQALDRTQPGLPLKPGKAGTMTHDYKRPAPRHPVRRARRARGHRHQPLHATPPAGSSAFWAPSSGRCRPAR